jgi:exonuclease SbcD
MSELRILHTSDIHLGAPFLFLGARGNEQRLALREALAKITRLAREEKYHALLIAGDLFDAPFGSSEADVSFAVGCCAEAGPGCRVIVLPGSHDFYSAGTLFEREHVRFEASGHVCVLTPQRPVIELPDLSLAVHGKALTSATGNESAFSELSPVPGCRWNVCVAHGSAEGASAAFEPQDNPLRLTEIDPGFNYVALGHWHSYRVVRERSPLAVYSGSPEIIARDQRGAGSVVSVTVASEGPRIERIPVGRRRIAEVSVDCTGLAHGEEFLRRVVTAAPPDKDLILELSLTGLIGIEVAFDPERELTELERRYFSVRFVGRGPGREFSKEELLRVPEDSVAGKFVRVILRRIEKAEGDKKELLEEALQLGYQLFKGRDLIG